LATLRQFIVATNLML